MSRRRVFIGLSAIIAVALAACVLGYLYLASRDELLARADQDLQQVAREAAAKVDGLFSPARLGLQQMVDARLDRQPPGEAERQFFGIARAIMDLAPQIARISLARPDGSFLVIQSLIPKQLGDVHVLPESYSGLIRATRDWRPADGYEWSYWDNAAGDWANIPLPPSPYDPRIRP